MDAAARERWVERYRRTYEQNAQDVLQRMMKPEAFLSLEQAGFVTLHDDEESAYAVVTDEGAVAFPVLLGLCSLHLTRTLNEISRGRDTDDAEAGQLSKEIRRAAQTMLTAWAARQDAKDAASRMVRDWMKDRPKMCVATCSVEEHPEPPGEGAEVLACTRCQTDVWTGRDTRRVLADGGTLMCGKCASDEIAKAGGIANVMMAADYPMFAEAAADE